MPDGQRILSGGNDDTIRVWLLDGTHKNTFVLHADRCSPWRCPTTSTRSPARRLHRQALQRQRRHRSAHLQAPHGRCTPGTAARRPPLHQRLAGQHRLHRRARPRAAEAAVSDRQRVQIKSLPRHLAQPSIASSIVARSSSTVTRRCSVESRSRSVTVPSPSIVSKSTVTQNGVPTSSIRR